MEPNKLLQAIKGMLITIERDEKSDDWTKDFLNHIKSALEQQQKEIERLEKQLEDAVFTDTGIKAKPHSTFEID